MGFGEAASRFAKDFSQAGLSSIFAYSPSLAQAESHDPLQMRAAEAGVIPVPTPKALCERSTLIIALTPGSAALAALRRLRPHLRPDHIYVDATTASVKAMEQAAKLLAGRGAFVDAAIMDPVPMHGIKVLTVASGSHAGEFQALLAPYGMNIQVIGGKPGAASAMKLMRSVCMKGLAAVLLESLEAAQRYGIVDALVADMSRFIDGQPFEQVIKRFVCGTAIHAPRRIPEMTEALALLKSLDASTRMTRATRGMISEVADMGLRERFGAREPDRITPVLEAIVEIKGRKAER